MVDILSMKGIKQEAKFLREKTFNVRLLEILSRQREGTAAERRKLKKITRKIGDKIYVEAVYVLTNQVLGYSEAKEIFHEILVHRKRLVEALKRHVSIQVAALDYMQNILSVLDRPVILDERKERELARETITDEVTKAFDVNLLASDVDLEIEKFRRKGRPFSVIFLDVDNLKKINDAYGHLMGNRILEYLTAIVKRNLRRSGSVYRYGGDEFVILLPGMSVAQASLTARRIRKTLADIRKNGELPPQVSMGIAGFGTPGIADRHSLLYAADHAMYEAKRAGKDRVCVYQRSQNGATARVSVEFEKQPKPAQGRLAASGVTVAPGLAMGRAFQYKDIMTREFEVRDLEPSQVQEELARIKAAIAEVKKDVTLMKANVRKAIGRKHAAIFDVHRTILEDIDILKEIDRELRERLVNAEHVVQTVFRRWEKKLKASDSEIIQERSNDVADVGRSLLRYLAGTKANILAELPPDSVIFAHRLLPSDTVHLNVKKTRGIVTQEGGIGSHAAILAKGLQVPSISKISCKLTQIPDGAPVLVDGDKGEVVIHPDAKEAAKFKARMREESRRFTAAMIRPTGKKARCIEGIRLSANAASANDVLLARRYACNGIGLYRIEQIYMRSKILPSEEFLYNQLSHSLVPARGMDVVVRLLDIGGDKTLPYLDITEKQDSALGLRGVRLLLKYPALLKTQIGVCLRLSRRFRIKILVPMVTLASEMEAIRQAVDREKERLRKARVLFNEKIEIGAMIETPAAVLSIEDILPHSDFLSIGTNDLVQYVMVADREKQSVASYYESGNRLVIKWLEGVVAKADESGRDVEICGELAGDPAYTKQLLGVGLKHFSIVPFLIPRIRDEIIKIRAK